MKNVRKRFTIPEDQLLLAEEYARFTNRTLAELIVESLLQTRHRHIRRDEKRAENRLEDRLDVLEEKVAQLTGQRTYRAEDEGVRADG